MKAGMTIEEAVVRIDELEAHIHQRFPEIAWCPTEPSNKD